jgi:hypothetical protein
LGVVLLDVLLEGATVLGSFSCGGIMDGAGEVKEHCTPAVEQLTHLGWFSSHLLSYELNRQRNNRINGCNCRGVAVMFVQCILRTDDNVK